MKKKKLLIVILTALTLTLLYVVTVGISIWQYGNKDEKRQADATIVLGAATYNGKISPVFQERINHGIWLYENGFVKKIIFTGGYGEGNEISDAATAKIYALSRGISETDILIEEKSTITEENLEYGKEIMKGENLETAIIVSDPLHQKRAMLMAKDYGITAFSSPTPTTRYITLKSKIPFLLREMFFYVGYRIYRIVF